MTSIFTRQIEEMEIFQATWQSDILQTQQTQRQEYREFVIELYREYQSRLASVSKDNTIAGAEKKLDGKEIVHAAAGRVRQWENNNTSNTENSILSGSDKSSTIASRPCTGSLASSLGSSPKQSVTEDEPSAVQIILELGLGFAKEQAESALVLSNHNVEAATELLLENPAKVDAYMAEQKLLQQQQQQQQQIVKPPTSSSTPYRRSHSLSQVPRPQFLPTTPPNGSIHSRQSSVTLQENRRHSLQRFGTTPTFFNIMSNKNSNNTTNNNNQNTPHNNINHAPNATTAVPTTTTSSGKSWNPISFLQQQKQAMENTNLSSVRKLGGWLGKAMENFGIDDEHQDGTQHKSRQSYLRQQSAPQLVESFTIMTGTAQIKCSHNLRLLVTDEATELFHPVYDSPREMAYRAETATKLYTSHLSAVIVLVEVSELTRKQGWRLYMTGKGSNKALMERCQQSTEFHFADMESQLTVIEKDFANGGLVEGSFFVTKHSNLPSTQVVYHLLIDSAGKKTIFF
jgi:hypothetical protein